MGKHIILIFGVFLIAIILAGTGFAQPISDNVYVSPTGSDDTGTGTEENPFQTVMFGIIHVTDAGTVHLDEGTYDKNIDENSKDNNITIEKNVTIQGAKKDTTIIDGKNLYSLFYIPGDYTVNIKDLTIQNCKPDNECGAIVVKHGTLNVINCNFVNNEADDVGGAIANSGTVTVTNSLFNNNKATNRGGAIFNYGGTLTVTGSTFTGNSANMGGAIFIYPGMVKLSGNNFLNNDGNGIYIGYFLRNSGTNGISTIEINVNRIVGNTPYGLYVNLVPVGALAAGSDMIGFQVDATNNWWGSNNDPRTLSNAIYDPLNYADTSKWLVLKVSAVPVSVVYGSTSLVTASVVFNNLGEDTSLIGHIPDGTPITITTDIGNVGSKSVTRYTAAGIVSTIFRADDGLGTAHIYALLDGFMTPLPAEVVVTAASSVSAKTVPMQATGTPLLPLLVAAILMVGGVILPGRKK
ncbi:right-handed parallel beta-helix repeat-containing protein [Methanobacterium petrolearium]|uniref:right-handed parallel beta-helix repeat-containing protein n=1 Tax=Methanobacterium petrolearium TaxID=710190 RepID=UPI001AE27354|nr:right-handed parallel beta-helix repeat-containing protein [Methanobacterium petrolearium]MBP1946289.1 putative outer membrane repeat protein [Methanobacterium petrolearium]BDZ71385.1 hypothetical protein GCM10025861_19020 [Methanobacterium petrolearium]